MSDLVFFGKRDGFPQLSAPNETSSTNGYPFAFAESELHGFYDMIWRVKEWEIDISGFSIQVFTDPDDYNVNVDFPLASKTKFILLRSYDKEHQLCKEIDGNAVDNFSDPDTVSVYYPNYPGGPESMNATLGIEVNLMPNGGATQIKKAGNYLMPFFFFQTWWSGVPSAYTISTSTSPAGIEFNGKLKLQIGSFVKEASLFLFPNVSGTTAASSGDIILKPSKWWTYGGLYDEDTGNPVA